MPGLDEIIRSLTGSYLLARRDVSGYGYFNQTIEGFWRSFAAIIFIAPVYFLFASFELDVQPQGQFDEPAVRDAGTFYAIKGGTLLLDWITFPIVMVFISSALGFSRRYVPYIIAYNWSTVLIWALLVIPIAIFHMGLASKGTVDVMSLLCLMLVVYYRWYIARTALETSGLNASGLVILELALSFIISSYSDRLLAV